jgi:hypothetical protein
VFGRATRLIALLAVVTHVWASLIVAPWHQLVAHRLPTLEPTTQQESSPPPTKRFRCGHHAQCTPPAANSERGKSSENVPLTPDDEDNCSICQVLAQPYSHPEIPVPVLTRQFREFSPPVSAVQPLLGCLIDPVSRGPPAA